MDVDRRLFLLTLAVPFYPAVPLVKLSAADAKVIEALCAQIIPADESPGAREAGVLYYIETQLGGPLERFVEVYRKGVAALNSACQQKTGKAFIELGFAEQTGFLRQLETGGHSEANQFFQIAVDHTMQGFYGSPKHGGNKEEASWKMLGITDVMEGHKH